MSSGTIHCVIAALSCSAASAAPVQRSTSDAGTTYLGAAAGKDWGRPVASGDLDGDGFDEIIVGSSRSFGGILSSVYVLRGGSRAHGSGVVDLAVVGADQVILGAAVDDNLGSSIAAGDVTGDGVDDLLICASSADFFTLEGAGVAYLIFGGPNFFGLSTRDLSLAGSWDLRIGGPVAFGDMGGGNLLGGLDAHGAAVGFLNGDIYGDIVLGVHLAAGGASESGRVYVIFGGPFTSGFTLNLAIPTNYDVRINGAGRADELGTVVLAGDVTGDGIEELILPTEWSSQGLFTSEGAVFIFRGRTSWAASYSLLTTPADITLIGAREDDNLGAAAAVGDFNGDGVKDLAVGAPGADAGAFDDQRGDGFVYGLLGSGSYQSGTHLVDYATAAADFAIIGEYQENLGTEVAAGDFNGDGTDDVAAAEWFAGPQTNGVVEVLFGRAFAGNPTYGAGLDTDVRIVGAASDRIGFSLGASDVNSDGLDEVVYGTPFNNGNKGSVYLYSHVTGDSDHDGDSDLRDFAAFQTCFTGQPIRSGEWSPGCFEFDFDLDLDVDLLDLAAFVDLIAGPAR